MSHIDGAEDICDVEMTSQNEDEESEESHKTEAGSYSTYWYEHPKYNRYWKHYRSAQFSIIYTDCAQTLEPIFFIMVVFKHNKEITV